MDDATRKAIEDRANALWEEAGRPDGSTLLYWLRAEQEHGIVPGVDAEDPIVTLHELAQAALEQRESDTDTAEAVSPEIERLPGGAEADPGTASSQGSGS